jgi:hypothetical protein
MTSRLALTLSCVDGLLTSLLGKVAVPAAEAAFLAGGVRVWPMTSRFRVP